MLFLLQPCRLPCVQTCSQWRPVPQLSFHPSCSARRTARSSTTVSLPPLTSHVSVPARPKLQWLPGGQQGLWMSLWVSHCHLAHSPAVLRPTQDIMSSTWYDHYYGTEDSYLAVLIPNPFHQRSSPETWRVPVGTEECGQSRATCNGKLKANEQYR